jgi:hypothetical protein
MYLTRRARHAESARVDRMLHAIALSGRYTVDEEWTLHTVPDEDPAPVAGWRTDTVAFPAIILAGTIL